MKPIPTLLCAAALAGATLAARADNDDAEQLKAIQQQVQSARDVKDAQAACTQAVAARGLTVRKADRVKLQDNAPIVVFVETTTRGSVGCEYDPAARATTLLDVALKGDDVSRGTPVKLCEQAADQQGIRLGRFDELKPMEGRRTEVRFDRPFLGKRHTCLVDLARNLVSFDGGKPVALPGTGPAKK